MVFLNNLFTKHRGKIVWSPNYTKKNSSIYRWGGVVCSSPSGEISSLKLTSGTDDFFVYIGKNSLIDGRGEKKYSFDLGPHSPPGFKWSAPKVPYSLNTMNCCSE